MIYCIYHTDNIYIPVAYSTMNTENTRNSTANEESFILTYIVQSWIINS